MHCPQIASMANGFSGSWPCITPAAAAGKVSALPIQWSATGKGYREREVAYSVGVVREVHRPADYPSYDLSSRYRGWLELGHGDDRGPTRGAVYRWSSNPRLIRKSEGVS